jgi:hypothetical protein
LRADPSRYADCARSAGNLRSRGYRKNVHNAGWASYRLGIAKETAPVRAFFFIVNFPLTMIFPDPPSGRYSAH